MPCDVAYPESYVSLFPDTDAYLLNSATALLDSLVIVLITVSQLYHQISFYSFLIEFFDELCKTQIDCSVLFISYSKFSGDRSHESIPSIYREKDK